MTPGSWPEAMSRFAEILGGGTEAQAAAEEWLRQAIEARFAGSQGLHELSPTQRALAFQWWALMLTRAASTPDDPAFSLDQRERTRMWFAAIWGVTIDGPPWRLSPGEHDRPTYEQWGDAAAFDDPPTAP